MSGSAQDILLSQWLAALWLGAANIATTQVPPLGGSGTDPRPGRAVSHQREQLRDLATDPLLIKALFGFNQKLLGESIGTDFYFDPHVKHYTGEQNVLKGWCPKIRFADKILQSDFIHTTQGSPIYFETTDNFADLRERFFGVVQRARAALGWPLERVLTLVVDRGVWRGRSSNGWQLTRICD